MGESNLSTEEEALLAAEELVDKLEAAQKREKALKGRNAKLETDCKALERDVEQLVESLDLAAEKLAEMERRLAAAEAREELARSLARRKERACEDLQGQVTALKRDLRASRSEAKAATLEANFLQAALDGQPAAEGQGPASQQVEDLLALLQEERRLQREQRQPCKVCLESERQANEAAEARAAAARKPHPPAASAGEQESKLAALQAARRYAEARRRKQEAKLGDMASGPLPLQEQSAARGNAIDQEEAKSSSDPSPPPLPEKPAELKLGSSSTTLVRKRKTKVVKIRRRTAPETPPDGTSLASMADTSWCIKVESVARNSSGSPAGPDPGTPSSGSQSAVESESVLLHVGRKQAPPGTVLPHSPRRSLHAPVDWDDL